MTPHAPGPHRKREWRASAPFVFQSCSLPLTFRIASAIFVCTPSSSSHRPPQHLDIVLPNMAPQELVGRYRKYRSATNGLLYWITTTAGTCCNLKDVKSLASTSKSATRPPQAPYYTGDYEISTDELIQLAEKICSSDPPIEVPEGIVLILRDAINRREACAAWYSGQALKVRVRWQKRKTTTSISSRWVPCYPFDNLKIALLTA